MTNYLGAYIFNEEFWGIYGKRATQKWTKKTLGVFPFLIKKEKRKLLFYSQRSEPLRHRNYPKGMWPIR